MYPNVPSDINAGYSAFKHKRADTTGASFSSTCVSTNM